MILAIETSCDDTCAAVVDDGHILSNVISSQAATHAAFGGVVPEIASRHHLELVNPIVDAALSEAGVALDDLDAVAVTRGPGLIGALLVGVSTAKALAAARRLPMIEVDHLHGHVAANFLEPEPLEPPFLCLIASGGHTLLAGVKAKADSRPSVRRLTMRRARRSTRRRESWAWAIRAARRSSESAREGDPEAFAFPVAMARDPGLNFSFSGLKTALVYAARDLGEEGLAERACRPRGELSVGGSRPADGEARAGARSEAIGPPSLWAGASRRTGRSARVWARSARSAGLRLKLVPRELCTDNAAMIGAAAETWSRRRTLRISLGMHGCLDEHL